MEVFCWTRVTDRLPLIPEVYVEIYLDGTSGISDPTSQQEGQPKRFEDELQSAYGRDFHQGMGALSWSHD
jgi:hypothetical protein